MFILLDKPHGWTSHDIVAKIRRLYPEEKVGHGGTLDPYATWLLVVAVGKDTKKISSLLGASKTYIATIDFSLSTDTWDLQYRKEYTQRPVDHATSTIVIQWVAHAFPSPDLLTQKLHALLGEHYLPLTPFSAKKVRGKKLYEYARAGTPIFLDVPMLVKDIHLLDISFPQITVGMTVGSWTYVRSIAYRLGQQVGLWGTVTMLRRIQIGKMHVPEKK